MDWSFNSISDTIQSDIANVKTQVTNVVIESYTRLGLFVFIGLVIAFNLRKSK